MKPPNNIPKHVQNNQPMTRFVHPPGSKKIPTKIVISGWLTNRDIFTSSTLKRRSAESFFFSLVATLILMRAKSIAEIMVARSAANRIGNAPSLLVTADFEFDIEG